MTKRPDAAPPKGTSKTAPKTPANPAAQAAAPGTLVPSHGIGDGRAGAAPPRDPAPAIESTLVGTGGKLPPMSPRPAASGAENRDAPLRLEAAAGAAT
ncbi:MAG TPA: hypothetical protein GXX24_03685, partial [Paracoccus solventivorans]|nr:hypothetical protein [Paracoccus solventivorans]